MIEEKDVICGGLRGVDSVDDDKVDCLEVGEKRGEESKSFEDLIPKYIREELMLISFETPEGIAFDKYVKALVDECASYYKKDLADNGKIGNGLLDFDFEKYPVRFVLSDLKRPNAFYLSIVDGVDVICISKSIFDRIVNSPEALAYVVFHELTHANIKHSYGNKKNSKIEEGAAYSLPLEMLRCHPHYNPESALDTLSELYSYAQKRHRKRDIVDMLVDPHPMNENTLSVVEVYLANMRRMVGDLLPDEPCARYEEGDELMSLLERARYKSYIDRKIDCVEGYSEMKLAEKVDSLINILNDIDSLSRERILDWNRAVSNLEFGDQDQLHRLADAVIDFILDREDIDGALVKLLYLNLQKLHDGEKRLPAVGRFRNLYEALELFVESVDFDEDEIAVNAEELVYQLDEIADLMESNEGRNLLKLIEWPEFSFVEIEDEDFSDEDEDSEYCDEEEEDFESKTVVWSSLYELAKNDKNVLRAAMALGLVYDRNFKDALINHPDFAKKFILNGCQSISVGPSSGVVDLKWVEIDDEGFVCEIKEKADKNELDLYVREVIAEILGSMIDNYSPEDEENILNMRDYLTGSLNGIDYLLFPRICESNMELFFSLNPFHDTPAMRAFLLEKISEWLNDESKHFLIRELYLYHYVPRLEDRFLDESYKDHEISIKEKMTALPSIFNLKANALIKLFLSEGISSLFSIDERRQVIERIFLGFSTVDEFGDGAAQSIKDQIELFDLDYSRDIYALKDLEVDTFIDYAGIFISLRFIYYLALNILYVSGDNLGYDDYCEYVEKMGVDVLALSSCSEINRIISEKIAENNSLTSKNKYCIERMAKDWSMFTSLGYFDSIESSKHLNTLIERIKNEKDLLVVQNTIENILAFGRIEKPNQRLALIELWINAVFGRFGYDDDSLEYFENISIEIDRVIKNVARVYHVEIFDNLSKKIQGQHKVCSAMRGALTTVKDEDVENAYLYGVVAESGLVTLRESVSKETLGFLLSKRTRKSVDEFILSCKSSDALSPFLQSDDKDSVQKFVKGDKKGFVGDIPEILRSRVSNFYDIFWSSSFEMRTVMIRELFVGNFKEDNDRVVVNEKTLSYVVDKLFSNKNDSYYQETRIFIEAYVKSLPFYQQPLALSSLMVASKKNENNKLSLGEILTIVLEMMGPAETKIGQGAESHPRVPLDIRKDMRRLKFNANEPMRWNITERIESLRSDIELSYNKYIGTDDNDEMITLSRIKGVSGSASIFVAVEVEMSDGSNHILAIKRPYVNKLAVTGFNSVMKMLDNMGNDLSPSIKDTLGELVELAKGRLDVETNCLLADYQYQKAEQLYGGKKVMVGDNEFNFRSPKVTSSGENFFMMEKIEGKHFIENGNDDQKSLAMAILAVEFSNILKGIFDSDRHGGNIKIDGNNIGHFDFKALSLSEWDQSDFDQFAEVIFSFIFNISNVEDFVDCFLDAEEMVRARGEKLGGLVIEVKKAILSLGDYARYLDKEDFIAVLFAAVKSGIDDRMLSAFMKHCPENIKPFVMGFFGADNFSVDDLSNLIGLDIENVEIR